tara:strand:+ start:349 stop:1092 length:744 start_codon:yes stop_codon:yes gene_type:complete
MIRALIIIPVRMASSRFPGKPLININGKTMIERVWESAVKSKIGDVYVACCDKEIKKVLIKKKINYIVTKKNLKSGTDRVYEAYRKLNNRGDYNLIINLQGDIPYFNYVHLNKLYNLAKEKKFEMATLASLITKKEKLKDTNIVKVVMANYKKNIYRAIYFSRLPVPYGSSKHYEHIGVYAYSPYTLKNYITMKNSRLESDEKLEQLRALEAEVKIYVGLVNNSPISIDTPKDLKILNKNLNTKEKL